MKYFLFIVMLSTVGFAREAKAQDAMSVWTSTPIKIDGHSREWPSFFRFYVSGAKAQFDFFNDSTNLYLCIKASNVEAQARLMHAGVNIWLDPLGKKKQKEGITFPVKIDREPGDRISNPRGNGEGPSESARAGRLREQVIFAQTMIKVTGMIAVKEPTIPLENKYGIEAAYDWDSLGILAIEYKIPLTLILQHPVTGADLERPIGLGLVIGATEASHVGSNQSPQGNQGQQRGMGGGGGGMGGQRGGGNNGQGLQNNLANDRFNGDTQEQKVWLKVHLESKPAQQ